MISTKDDFTKAFLECTKKEGYIDLPQEILDGRLDFLFVMNELTNYKLTVSQLNKLYIILAGLLLGKYPKIAFEVQQSDRIRLPYAAIDLLPATKGKLTSQEKLLFAFCTFYSVCSLEMDKMWSYCHDKKHQEWLWWAIDHENRSSYRILFWYQRVQSSR